MACSGSEARRPLCRILATSPMPFPARWPVLPSRAYRNETADELRAALGQAEADAAIKVVISPREIAASLEI